MPEIVDSMPKSQRGRKVQYEWLHKYCEEPQTNAGEYPQNEFHDSGFGKILKATRGKDFTCGVASFAASVCRVTDKAGLGVIISIVGEDVWIQSVTREIKPKVNKVRKVKQEAALIDEAAF